MTQSNYPNPDDATVTIIPKSIKIYSDNPIHDAIDRLIDVCSYLEAFGQDRYYLLEQVKHIGEELSQIAEAKMLLVPPSRLAEQREQKTNKD